MSVTEFTPEEQAVLDEGRLWPRFLLFPVGVVAGYWALVTAWPTPHWMFQAFWVVFVAYSLFCSGACFHETVHQTINGSRTFNIWLGRAVGTFLTVPYSVYRESHIRHHAYLNQPADWELWPYSDPNASLTFRRIFVWFDLLAGIVVTPYIYGRIFFHRNSPITSPSLRLTIRREYRAILVFWGAVGLFIAWLVARGVSFDFRAVWLLPLWLSGVLQSGRKLTEHLGMASYDPLLGTRTVIGPGRLTRWSTYFNFDIFVHGPHHRHPREAHHRLTRRMAEYVDANPETAYPVYSTYWRATWSMLPALFRNPGVGMNAGAPPPPKWKAADVQTFVADVSKEILVP